MLPSSEQILLNPDEQRNPDRPLTRQQAVMLKAFPWRHGTISAYKRHLRHEGPRSACPECLAAWAAYAKGYRERARRAAEHQQARQQHAGGVS